MRKNGWVRWILAAAIVWKIVAAGVFPVLGADVGAAWERDIRMSEGGQMQDTARTSGEEEAGWDWEEVLNGAFEGFDGDEVQVFLDGLSGGGEAAAGISFLELMKKAASGGMEEVLTAMGGQVKEALFSEIRTNAGLMGQILALALVGAVFSGFSGIFGSSHLSETGFYVIYLLMMTFLAASFFASAQVAGEVFGHISEFMRVLLPAYFMAVAMAGGAVTSSAVCGFTFAAIGVVQAVFTGILMPLARIYMLLVLAGNLCREDMISKMTELLRLAITWTMRTLFGVIIGFHVIQGMVLPQADALKNAAAMRFVGMLPGVGAGAGAISQIVMGSGILIKNMAGAAALVILVLMAAVPMAKLAVLTLLYYMAAAVMQPVCDKRLVACMSKTGEGHGILLRMVGYSLALFGATIAVLCVSTNAAWYAG